MKDRLILRLRVLLGFAWLPILYIWFACLLLKHGYGKKTPKAVFKMLGLCINSWVEIFRNPDLYLRDPLAYESRLWETGWNIGVDFMN